MHYYKKACLWRSESPSLQPPDEDPFSASVALAEATGILPLSPLTVLYYGVHPDRQP